jgi:hypothetical protein
MEVGAVPPGPNQLLLVLPDEELVAKALRVGIAVWVITDPRRHTTAWLRAVERQAELVLVRSGRVAEVAVETARRHGIPHVLPIEYSVAGRSSARQLTDTAAMRRLLNMNDRSVVRSRQAGSIAEVIALLRRFGFPSVVRSAAAPPVLVPDDDALSRWARADRLGPWLVEKFLVGPQFVVSTLTVDGMHRVIGVTAKRTTETADLGEGDYLHPAALSSRDRALVAATVTGLLDLADHEFGPAQTNVVLTTNGPCVVSSGVWFDRHRIPRLIELASGFDPETELLRALNGKPITPPTTNRCAALGVLSPPNGRLVSVSTLAEATALPGVFELHLPPEPEYRVPAEARGFVVVSGETKAEVVDRLRQIRQLLHAQIRPA